MKKMMVLGIAATMLAMGWQSAMAQPPGGGPGEMGGPGMGRGMRMGDRDKMELSRLWRGIGELTEKNSLSKAQAKSIVGLVRPWSLKPTMTSGQAKSLTSKLNAVLTSSQKSQLAKMRPQRGGRDGGGRDGGGRDGDGRGRGDGPPPGGMGGPPPGEGRDGDRRGDGPPPGFDPAKMRAQMQKMQTLQKTMNPFYPPTKYAAIKAMPARMQQGMTRRYDRVRSTLTALSRKAA